MLVKGSLAAGFHEGHQIIVQAHENGLGFRISKAYVKFQHIDLSLVNHQSCVQYPGKWSAALGHTLDGRDHHLVHGHP